MTHCKVRFAPSPTGLMHIGNARVAVINYLFCKKNKGKFLFRIDDTDAQRSKREYEDAIRQDIDWLGITYDETFRQSEKVNHYRAILKELYNKGLVYKCYETPEELEFKRKRALLKGVAPVYDRSALALTANEIRQFEVEKRPFYWRFKLPNETVVWNDLILGNISYDLRNISDPVVAKSDETFLYLFCSVIDDLDSSITHILRGQDHVTNTAVQIALIEAISHSKCQMQFAHFSLLVNKDGSQFSKRLGSMNLGELKNQGIDPMAICDLLATLGTSKDTVPFICMEELIEYFDIQSFSSNSPKFDINNLLQLNKKIVKLKSYQDVKQQLKLQMTEQQFNIIKDNINNYNDYIAWDRILTPGYKPNISISQVNSIIVKELKKQLQALLSNDVLQLSREQSVHLISEVSSNTNIKGKELYMSIQLAILGLNQGPHLADTLTMFSIDELIARVWNF